MVTKAVSAVAKGGKLEHRKTSYSSVISYNETINKICDCGSLDTEVQTPCSKRMRLCVTSTLLVEINDICSWKSLLESYCL